MDCCLPGSSVHGIFQARVLEWGAIAFSEQDNWGESKMSLLLNLSSIFFPFQVFLSIEILIT